MPVRVCVCKTVHVRVYMYIYIYMHMHIYTCTSRMEKIAKKKSITELRGGRTCTKHHPGGVLSVTRYTHVTVY